MKSVLLLFYFFFSLCSFSQNEKEALRVIVTDAVTGDAIKKARVTLEGYEIPPIAAKYSRKGKYYYFDKIPEGYNTVMAYHKKYNEKGFQNIDGLPQQLTLKLYTPYRVRLNDRFYMEDNKKLLLLFDKSIFKNDKYASLSDSEIKKKIIETDFPNVEIVNVSKFSSDAIIVKKKDNTSFKRFNDPVIKEISKRDNLRIYGLLLKTATSDKEYFSDDGTPVYLPDYKKYIDAIYISRVYELYNQFDYKLKGLYDYPQVEKYYKFLKKNKITDAAIRIPKSEKKKYYRDYTENSMYIYSTYNMPDTLKIENINIYKDFQSHPRMNKLIITALQIEDYFDPYIAVPLYLNDNEFYSIISDDELMHLIIKNNSAIKQQSFNNKQMYFFEGIVSPFGTLDLIEYYNNILNIDKK